MATMKLELNKLVNQPTEDLFIPSITGKNSDSQMVIKKRIAEAVSKKARPSELNKHRRKWAEETLALLNAQLPVNMQQTETAEKLMALCQLSVADKGLKMPDQMQLDSELPSADDLPLVSISAPANVLDLQLSNKPVVMTQSQKVDSAVEAKEIVSSPDIPTDRLPSKLGTQPISRLINRGNISHKPLSTSLSPLADIGDVSDTAHLTLTPARDISQSNIKPTHDGSTMLSNKQSKISMTSELFQTNHPKGNILKNNVLNSYMDTEGTKVVSPAQPEKQLDGEVSSQPIQHQVLDDHDEIPHALTMQNSHGTQTSTNTNVLVSTFFPSRQPANGVNKMAQVVEKTASISSGSTVKVESRSLTYTFNQWQNSPSVTFEIAARGSELLATTSSPEVHRALHENQHLFRSEQPLSIRHEEQRHERQRQQQHEQLEQEDN